jgi:hypothetical protein
VRDACDLGYLVTVPDRCLRDLVAERHDWSLRNNRGYCRQRTTQQLLDEIGRLAGGRHERSVSAAAPIEYADARICRGAGGV